MTNISHKIKENYGDFWKIKCSIKCSSYNEENMFSNGKFNSLKLSAIIGKDVEIYLSKMAK